MLNQHVEHVTGRCEDIAHGFADVIDGIDAAACSLPVVDGDLVGLTVAAGNSMRLDRSAGAGGEQHARPDGAARLACCLMHALHAVVTIVGSQHDCAGCSGGHAIPPSSQTSASA